MGGSRVVEQAECPSPAVARPAADAVALPLGVALAVLAFAYWCVDIVTPALPAIRDSLDLSATGAGLVFSAFFAGRLVSNLPAAWLVERAGPKWTAVTGAATLLVGSGLASIATSPALLLPARGVQGAGVAILATAGLLSVLRALPGRGAAMTAFNVASGVGGAGGLVSGGLLTVALGWRAIFWFSSLLTGALLAGTLLSRVAAALPHGGEPVRGEPGAGHLPSRAAEAAAIAANLLVFINYAVWTVSLSLLGAVKFGFTAEQVGLLLLFVNVVHLLSAIPVGRVIGAVGATGALAAGFAIGGIGLVLAPLAPSPTWLVLPMALYAVGQVAGNSSAGDLILRLGGGGGRAVGAVRLSSDLGLVAGPAAVGALADAAGVGAPFSVLGAATLMVALATALLGRLRRGGGD